MPLLSCKHWLRQNLLLIAHIEYQIVFNIWSTDQICTYQFPCCIVSSRCFSFLWLYFIIGCLAGTIWLAVICERGNLSLSYYLLPFQNPRSQGTSPLGLASLKRKNLPIVVTLGVIGSCYANLAFYLIAFTPSYKLCDNILAPLPRNTESVLPQMTNLFGKPCLRDYFLTSLLGDSTRVFSLFLW